MVWNWSTVLHWIPLVCVCVCNRWPNGQAKRKCLHILYVISVHFVFMQKSYPSKPDTNCHIKVKYAGILRIFMLVYESHNVWHIISNGLSSLLSFFIRFINWMECVVHTKSSVTKRIVNYQSNFHSKASEWSKFCDKLNIYYGISFITIEHVNVCHE